VPDSSAAKPPAVRLRQGLALLGGAVAIELLLGLGPLDFFWTPLLVGLAYLAAAALGGRANGHWATAMVIVAFGAVVLLLDKAHTGINLPAGYLLAVGLGGMAAAALQPRGFSVDGLGIAGAIAAVGLFLFLVDEYPNVLAKGRRLRGAARPRRRREPRARRRAPLRTARRARSRASGSPRAARAACRA